MKVSHTKRAKSIVAEQAIIRIQQAIDDLRKYGVAGEDFESFEQQMYALFVAAKREVLPGELSQLDKRENYMRAIR